MNCLIWNARGLGSTSAFHELQRLLAKTSPNLVFISETKLVTSRCSWWRAALGMHGMFVVDAQGQSGGSMLLWDELIDVRIKSYSEGHIDSMIEGAAGHWRFTGIYGNPVTDKRKFTWELLRRLATQEHGSDKEWLVGGDFNEILQDTEKLGGRQRPLNQMRSFREALMFCCLREIAIPDTGYTWFNNREEGPIFARLDRFFGNDMWQRKFASSSTHVLDFHGSDHRPVLYHFSEDKAKMIYKGKGRFHFEDKWLMHVAMCGNFLSTWSAAKCNVRGKEIAELRKRRQQLMNQAGESDIHLEINKLTKEIEAAVEIEACHWKQRARIN